MTRFLMVVLLMIGGGTVFAQEPGPGDWGYLHDEYHEAYQSFFDANRCHCAVGECRPTNWRSDPLSATGIEVLVDGEWIDVPEDALLDDTPIPPVLWRENAHVCAYSYFHEFEMEGGTVVECVVVNLGT